MDARLLRAASRSPGQARYQCGPVEIDCVNHVGALEWLQTSRWYLTCPVRGKTVVQDLTREEAAIWLRAAGYQET